MLLKLIPLKISYITPSDVTYFYYKIMIRGKEVENYVSIKGRYTGSRTFLDVEEFINKILMLPKDDLLDEVTINSINKVGFDE